MPTLAMPANASATLDDPDAALLHRFRQHGDREALGELFARNAKSAYRVARTFVASANDAEDVVQAAFMQIMDRAGQFANKGMARGWILAIVANTARMRLREEAGRKRREQASANDRPLETNSEDDRHDDELRQALRVELADLPERYRRPLLLHYDADLSPDDVAVTLGRSLNTVNSQLRRGISRLRSRLARRGHAVPVMALAGLFGSNQAESISPDFSDRLAHLARERQIGPAQTVIGLSTSAWLKVVAAFFGLGFAAVWFTLHLPDAQDSIPSAIQSSLAKPVRKEVQKIDPALAILPEGTSVIQDLNLSHTDFGKIWDRVSPTELAKLREMTGMDPRQIVRIVAGMVKFSGPLERGAVVTCLDTSKAIGLQDMQALIERYRDMDVLKWKAALIPGAAFAVLDAQRFVVGTAPFVKQVIDVYCGSAPGLTGREIVSEAYRSLPAGAFYRVVLGIRYGEPGASGMMILSVGSLSELKPADDTVGHAFLGRCHFSSLTHFLNPDTAVQATQNVEHIPSKFGVEVVGHPDIRVKGADLYMDMDIELSEESLMKGLQAFQ
jgi:RNA polymerase sigma-70 factor (ECF subfamily)